MKEIMKKLSIGSRVRYIGGQQKYNNAALYLLIGRTGVIKSKSTITGMDWHVVMDFGVFDIDAGEKTLEPIEEDHSDLHLTDKLELETA